MYDPYKPGPAMATATAPQPVVVLQAPPSAIGVPVMNYAPDPWKTGLCSCCDDCRSCCLTCWCPCIAFGRIAHIVDGGLTSCCGSGCLFCILMWCGCQWIYSCIYRRNLRMTYNLPETPCCDCCVQFCCELCSLCQMYRELQCRGFDMSQGYRQNMERLVRTEMQPPTIRHMTR